MSRTDRASGVSYRAEVSGLADAATLADAAAGVEPGRAGLRRLLSCGAVMGIITSGASPLSDGPEPRCSHSSGGVTGPTSPAESPAGVDRRPVGASSLDPPSGLLRLGVVGTFVALALAGGVAPIEAQEDELTDLSLEQLLQLDVRFVNALGLHTHLAGEWMIGYRFMTMQMDGNRVGGDPVTDEEVLEDFPVTPKDMNSQNHMFMVMHAPSNSLTLTAMLPYRHRSMSHVTRSGATFETESSGVGALSLGAIYTAVGDVMSDPNRLLLIGGVDVPTGSVEERDATPAGDDQLLPYPMDIQSGTVDLKPGVAFIRETLTWASVVEARTTLRLGRNSRGYAMGDRLKVAVWGAWAAYDWIGPSLQVKYETWGDVQGADPDLNPRMVPTADPDLRGGTRVLLKPGVDVYFSGGPLEGHRFSSRLGLPVHRSLDGPQLETDWTLEAGWTWTF